MTDSAYSGSILLGKLLTLSLVLVSLLSHSLCSVTLEGTSGSGPVVSSSPSCCALLKGHVSHLGTERIKPKTLQDSFVHPGLCLLIRGISVKRLYFPGYP